MRSLMPTKRKCPACKGLLWLESGVVARCPHCGQVVSAALSAGASSLRASDRKGWRFLGQHGGNAASRETPFMVKGQQPDREALAVREAMQRSLREKRAYWEAELRIVEDEFGPMVAAHCKNLWLG